MFSALFGSVTTKEVSRYFTDISGQFGLVSKLDVNHARLTRAEFFDSGFDLLGKPGIFVGF